MCLATWLCPGTFLLTVVLDGRGCGGSPNRIAESLRRRTILPLAPHSGALLPHSAEHFCRVKRIVLKYVACCICYSGKNGGKIVRKSERLFRVLPPIINVGGSVTPRGCDPRYFILVSF